MILFGDEMGRTQQGNNNAYCQDNEISWMDWRLLDSNPELFNFCKRMIAFRRAHPGLRGDILERNQDNVTGGYPALSWHGTRAWDMDWSHQSRTLAFLILEKRSQRGTAINSFVYVAMNMHWEAHDFELPGVPDGVRWHVFANTDMKPPLDIMLPGQEVIIENQTKFLVGARSVVVLIGR